VPPPTLLVIDVQRALDDPSFGERNNPAFERNLAALLEAWRERGAPVVHVRNVNPSGLFARDSPGFDYKPEAAPLQGEPELVKHANSAFIGTDLEERLRADGVRTVAVAGLTTDHCCSSTARMASDLGFETWVIEDAMATHARSDATGGELSAETMHRAALASLSGEFAEVMPLSTALERL
jgi:nicotinamidase-related amidase